jgi:dolichyl-diphosphooligosaccharide---protein glycosyltransferase
VCVATDRHNPSSFVPTAEQSYKMATENPNDILWLGLKGLLLIYFCASAYYIRCHAINEYGPIIHEFDPWFNMRATQYLADNGWTEFFHWFDHRSWYPLGRPVGTTIYPGMQITSVCIWKALNWIGYPMSLNDVCVYVPTWFGVLATLFVGLLTKECSGSYNAGLAAAGVMSIIPAHIMRSVGGGYDNESVAVTAMCSTFYFWVRSLRNEKSWFFGALSGLAYINMVAAWGGYVFVLNMIGVRAISLVFLGRHTTKLHRAYTLFYIIGTAGAIQVAVGLLALGL